MERKKNLLGSFGLGDNHENKAQPRHASWVDQPSSERIESDTRKPREKPGRKPSPIQRGRSKRQVTTLFFGDNFEYVMRRANELGFKSGQLCAYLNMLIDEDRKKHEGEIS